VSNIGRAILVGSCVLGTTAAEPGDVELTGYLGLSAPTYSQTFPYEPGLPPSIPGLRIEQRGSFDLTASGGIAFGAGLSWFPSGPLGIEARLDTADITLETRNASYVVGVSLPAPVGDISTEIDLPSARVDLERPRPVSLNLRLRLDGRVAFTASGGVSYLPSLDVSIVQPLALGIPVVGNIEIGELPVRAEGDPTREGSRWGGNLGLGVAIEMSEAVALLVEARGFAFSEHRLEWTRGEDRPLNPIEEALVDAALRSLPPIEFSPLFFNATVGLSLRF
jgi:hypothetical protein